MMYQDKLVTAVKVAGKVLREDKSAVGVQTVFVPFGSEYTIFIKNKNSLRAKVRVEIDGVDATEGTSLILGPNESIDFERFLKASNMEEGLKFKFIERTKKIEDGPRGIGAEDGLLRIEYEFEQQKPAFIPGPVYGGPVYRTYTPSYPWGTLMNASYSDTAGGATITSTANMVRSMGNRLRASSASSDEAGGGIAQGMNAMFSANASAASAIGDDVQFSSTMDSAPVDVPKNEAGITVGGSVSDQKFVVGAWFPTDGVKHVMILKLLGQVGDKKVEKAVTVKTKIECPTCGTSNAHGAKFCKECGTGLVLV
jgi:hypothetical protein